MVFASGTVKGKGGKETKKKKTIAQSLGPAKYRAITPSKGGKANLKTKDLNFIELTVTLIQHPLEIDPRTGLYYLR